jgi:hypothetical protein
MEDQPRSTLVAALVEAIDRRTPYQSDWIMRALLGGAWPAGHADRSYSSAAEWVRRWGPAPVESGFLDDCACELGRCTVCN